MHETDRLVDRSFRRNRLRRIEIDFLQFLSGIFQQHRFFKPEALQKILGFIAQLAEPAGNCLDSHRPLEKRIRNCRSHGIRIRMLVAGDVNRILLFHCLNSFSNMSLLLF